MRAARKFPKWIRKKLEGYGDDAASIRAFGLDVVTDLCDRLLRNGAPGLHFYTLNQAGLTTTIWQRRRGGGSGLRERGYLKMAVDKPQDYPEGSVGRLMEPALAVFHPEMTVAETVAQLRTLIKSAFITYGYVTDPAGHLLGIITMRDLLFADDQERLENLMLREVVFSEARDAACPKR